MAEGPSQMASIASESIPPENKEQSPADASPKISTPESQADEPRLRMTLGRDLVALGFIVVIAALAMALLLFPTAAEVAAAIGPVTTLVGTLVGTVFGVQAATQGQAAQAQASNQSSSQALSLAVQAATLLQPGDQQETMLRSLQRYTEPTKASPTIEVI